MQKVSTTLVLVMATWLFAQIGIARVVASDGTDDAKSGGSYQEKAIRWIDNYKKTQVLFHEKEIERLRKEMQDGTEEEAKTWLKETSEIRAALESSEWLQTRNWLKEFLKVQAIYSEEQINQFRDEAQEAARESPQKFTELLGDVEDKRSRLVQGAANSAQLRQHQLEVIRSYQQQAFEQRENARLASSIAAAAKPSPPATPVPPRERYVRPRPLVDSLDAARWSVMREFWRPW